jgi:hypothetical protein
MTEARIGTQCQFRCGVRSTLTVEFEKRQPELSDDLEEEPISRLPCSGIVILRPSGCVQRSWLSVCRRLTKPSAAATAESRGQSR